MNNTISERIKFIISELGYNINSFSKLINISNNVTIGRIVNENRNPSYDVLAKIIRTLGSLNARWLITGEGEMFEKECPNCAIKSKEIDHLKSKIEAYKEVIEIYSSELKTASKKEDKSKAASA